jgi:hypothetical protein
MKYLYLLLIALFAAVSAQAAPGAHGPNGEHLDGQAATATSGGSTPRVETFSEAFELVGHLSGGELSVLIDRYATNEPVLKGQLEVEYKNLKAKATFHPDLGDYAIDDEKLLKALSVPGKHALLFTLVAGDESDLLEGTLEVAAAEQEHGHAHTPVWQWLIGATLLAAIILAAVIARTRMKRKEK